MMPEHMLGHRQLRARGQLLHRLGHAGGVLQHKRGFGEGFAHDAAHIFFGKHAVDHDAAVDSLHDRAESECQHMGFGEAQTADLGSDHRELGDFRHRCAECPHDGAHDSDGHSMLEKGRSRSSIFRLHEVSLVYNKAAFTILYNIYLSIETFVQ
jgi:hypothetical protein